MNRRKNILIVLGEWWDEQESARKLHVHDGAQNDRSVWLPSRGNVLFTLLMIGLLLWAQTAGALPLGRFALTPSALSTSTIAYQGRLADASGNPLTQTVNMTFRLYNVAAGGGEGLWAEDWIGPNGVQVSDGLFNVMLGSLEPIPAALITSNSSLFLGITVGTDDEMAPRVQLGTVPFAVQALTVPGMEVTEIVRPSWGGTGTNATCINLIQDLRDRDYDSCTYVTSGEGANVWFHDDKCSGTSYDEPSLWQKQSLWAMQERLDVHPTRLKITGCCTDQAPYLICSRKP